MSRPKKQTVDFFPHYCKHGKTIYILEQKYQQNGYCFWFKLLEELGSHNGHILDFNDKTYCIFFGAKTMVSDTEMFDIMNLLAELGAIDQKLWEKRIVWCQNFVDNLDAVYAKRVVSAPEKPVSDTDIIVSGDGNPQSRVEESKVKKNRREELSANADAKQQNNTSVKKRSESQQVVDYWIEKYSDVFGDPPVVSWGKVVKLAKPKVSQLGLDRMKQIIDRYFVCDDEIAKKNKWDIATMLSDFMINKLK